MEAGRQAMIAAVVKLVHILEYCHAQPGQLSIALISFRMGHKMLTQENSNVVLNGTFCHVSFMQNLKCVITHHLCVRNEKLMSSG